MQTFETEHYLLHYGAGTPAERDIEKIAALQESCFSHICAVLGLTPDFKIEYFLCDSPEEVGRICGDDEPCNGFADLPNPASMPCITTLSSASASTRMRTSSALSTTVRSVPP